jgi:acetyl esterase/lipase
MSTILTEPSEWAGPPRFFPPPDPQPWPDGSRHFSGVTYALLIGFRPLQLDVWVPQTSEPPPVVMWIHGGAWLFGDRRYLPETLRPNQLFDELLAAGLAVASIDYRHSLEAQFPAQLYDAKAAVRYLRAHADVFGVDASRMGVMGESAGGHLASLVGLTGERADLEGDIGVVGPPSAVDAVVDWYGPAELGSFPLRQPPPPIAAQLPPEKRRSPEDLLLDGVDGAMRAAASPVNNVTPQAPPFLIIHGTADLVVPYAQSEILAKALTVAGVPVELVTVEGADHVFDGYADVDGLVRRSVNYLADALLRGTR